MPCDTCEDQRSAFRSWFSPVPIWFLGIKLRSSGLMPNTFACCAISLGISIPLKAVAVNARSLQFLCLRFEI